LLPAARADIALLHAELSRGHTEAGGAEVGSVAPTELGLAAAGQQLVQGRAAGRQLAHDATERRASQFYTICGALGAR
jgi:hypothetical protein